MAPPFDPEAVRAVLESDPAVRLAYLFGSHARGTAGAGSDLDVAAILDPEGPPGPYGFTEAESRLRSALEAVARREVDLVRLERAPPVLAFQVLKHGRCLVARSERERVAFEVRAMREFHDFRPRQRRMTSLLFR